MLNSFRNLGKKTSDEDYTRQAETNSAMAARKSFAS